MIYSASSHLHVVVYDFLFSDKYNQSYIKKNVLALPSFTMAVNGGQDFETPKSASIIKSAPGG